MLLEFIGEKMILFICGICSNGVNSQVFLHLMVIRIIFGSIAIHPRATPATYSVGIKQKCSGRESGGPLLCIVGGGGGCEIS